MNKKIRINEKNLSRLKKLIREEITLQEQKQLNEGVMDFLGSIFGSGADAIVDRLKTTVANALLERLGVNTDGFLARVAVNVFENLEISEIWGMIRGSQQICPRVAQELLEAIGETMFEYLPEWFGYEPDSWIGRTVFGTAREMLTNAIFRNNQYISRIAQAICSINIGSVFSDAGADSEQVETLQRSLQGVSRQLPAGQQLSEAKKNLNKILLEAKRNKK